MSKPVEENRWSAPADQFVTQIQLADVPGFFSKKLTIEPGTRALMIENGQFLGEVPAGSYTLETLSERLLPWHRKQTTVILARQEDVTLEISCSDVPTAENLLVAAEVRLTVQMEDVAMFHRNLLGRQTEFSTSDLQSALQPLIEQALWDSIGRMSITELSGPQVRGDLDAAIEQALGISMRRYGLRFGQVQTVSVRHDRYDQQRQKMGEAWLWKEGVEKQKQIDEIYSESELRKIRRQERTNELALLAEEVAGDREEGEVAAKVRRIGIRNKLREAVLSERFDEIKNVEEMAKMVQEQDKAKSLREQEKEELVELYREKKEDRQSARRHLLNKLDLDRTVEMENVRNDCEHSLKMKTLDHEMSLARRVESEENRRWLETLEKESRQAEHHRQEQGKQIQQQREWTKQEALDRRDDQWEELLHEQRTDRVRADLEVARAERGLRVDQMRHESELTQQTDILQFQKRQAEFSRENEQKTFANQIEKLQALQHLEQDQLRFRQDMTERKSRLDAELEALGEDKASERILARMQAAKDLGVEALIATADSDKAQMLADLEKHKASEQTKQVTSEALTQQKAETDKALDAQQKASEAERAKLQDRLVDSADAKADAIVQAYRDAMAAQQQTAQQALSSMGQMGQANVHLVGGQPVVPGQPGAPQQPAAGQPQRVLICSQCRAENPETARCCSNCGEKLQ